MILDKIVAHKLAELKKQKKRLPFEKLKKLVLGQKRKIKSLESALRSQNGKPHLICEMKKSSPSSGLLRRDFNPNQILKEFKRGGASAISVLTDSKFFKGSAANLIHVRKQTQKPILRKDFILDEYQVYESKLIGADVILLIVSILKPKRLRALTQLANYLGLEVITEIHDAKELRPAIESGARIIGINNRNLGTLKVNVLHSKQIVSKIPHNILKIVESGIESPEDIRRYQKLGVDGFLVGTSLMKSRHIAKLIESLRGKA